MPEGIKKKVLLFLKISGKYFSNRAQAASCSGPSLGILVKLRKLVLIIALASAASIFPWAVSI